MNTENFSDSEFQTTSLSFDDLGRASIAGFVDSDGKTLRSFKDFDDELPMGNNLCGWGCDDQ